MLGIVDWRYSQCLAQGVQFRFNTWAEVSDVIAETPDVVIIATGGIPHTDVVTGAQDCVESTWDVLSGSVPVGRNVLLYDDAGDHAALQAAELLAESGARVEIMTPDRTFAPEVMAMNLVPYVRNLQRHGVTFTVTYRLMAVERTVDGLVATVGSDYGAPLSSRIVDQVVVNHGTVPLDELYDSLKSASCNQGALDYDRLVDGRPQVDPRPTVGGGFELYRIGDAIAARNTHAAIYDAMRLAKDL
jgi:NADPH-dependent 2,4-dienoyl-CoA reductase/sulfur reductase-like enzyme